MTTDDDTASNGTDTDDGSPAERTKEELRKTRERLGEGAGKAVKGFDDNVVDLLAWLLDTETRARIYVYLRENPESTSDEVADGTGLYPSTVREALAELHDEETVSRKKREADGAGNNPYEYEAIAPSELVRGVVGDVQAELPPRPTAGRGAPRRRRRAGTDLRRQIGGRRRGRRRCDRVRPARRPRTGRRRRPVTTPAVGS